MCGRFSLSVDPAELAKLLALAVPGRFGIGFQPRYNIAPTQPVLAARLRSKPADASSPESQADPDTGRPSDFEWVYLRWGLIPAWADDRSIGNRMINARSESAAKKPAFRSAMKRHRCVIPADAFYEWQKQDNKNSGGKQPYAVRAHDGEPFAMAGLWERWHDDENDEVIESCTILTTDANETVAPLHDRMPVILSPDQIKTWLDVEHNDVDAAQRILKPAPDDLLTAYPVDRRVNKPQNDDPDVLQPVENDAASDDQPELF